jgi:hypothetical protein
VVHQWSCLALDTTPGGHDVLLIKVVRFLVVIVVGRNYNPLRGPVLPLLTTLGVLLGALDDDAGWNCFPIAWDKEWPDCLLVGGVLGGDVKQHLDGVPNDVIRCPEAWWLLRIEHAIPGRLWPQSLRTTAVSLRVTMSTPV